MKISSSQASLFQNKQQNVSYIPIKVQMSSRVQNNNSIENFSSIPPPQRFNQHNPNSSQQMHNANVFPHQKIQPVLKHSYQQQPPQQPQRNSKSERTSPQRMVSKQIGGIQQPQLNKTPTATTTTGISTTINNNQQDYSQIMNNNYSSNQAQPQFNYNPIQSFQNNQSQRKMNILKYVGQCNNPAEKQYQSISPQPHQSLQRVQSVQNYIKVGQLVNERNKNISIPPSPIGKQYHDNQSNTQSQSQNKFIYMPNIQLTNQAGQSQPEMLNANQLSFQNIDDLDKTKGCPIERKEGSQFILSPKLHLSTNNQQQRLQQQPSSGIRQLQNITNNIDKVHRNSLQSNPLKSRTLSSISFQKGQENQENTKAIAVERGYQKNQNENQLPIKKDALQLQTFQTNSQNVEVLNSQQQLESLIQETREQHRGQNQQQGDSIEGQLNCFNGRFESFQVNESCTINNNNNKSQMGQSTYQEQNLFHNYQQEPFLPIQSNQYSYYNSQVLANQVSHSHSINANQSVNQSMNEQRAINNSVSMLPLIQFQQHQQKLCHSPESFNESKNCDTSLSELDNVSQQKQTHPQREVFNPHSKNSHCEEGSLVEIKNQTKIEENTSDESYKQQFLSLQEENDRLQELIKNLNAQIDEQQKVQSEADIKLIQTEKDFEEVQRNAQSLHQENQEMKRQVEVLNVMIEQQHELENRYFLLEEKSHFYEEELAQLKQQDKEKSSALEKLQQHLSQLNDLEGDASSTQLEEYISERVMQLLDNQNNLKQQNKELLDENEEKDQVISEFEEEISQLKQRIKEFEDSMENVQQYVEDRVQKELIEQQQQIQQQESDSNQSIQQLNQQLHNAQQELHNQGLFKNQEISDLRNELETLKQKYTNDISQGSQKQDQMSTVAIQNNERFLSQQIRDGEKQIEDLMSLNKMYLNEIKEISTQHQKCYLLQSENESLKFQIDSYLFSVKDKESEIRQYQIKQSIQQTEWNSLQTTYQLQLSEKNQEISCLQSQLSKNKEELQLVQQNQISHHPEHSNKEIENSESTQYHVQLQQEYESIIQENNYFKSQLYSLENENRQMKVENESMSDNQSALQQEIYQLRQIIENKEEEQDNEMKIDFQYSDQNQSGAQNLEALMNAFSCQTIGTQYSKYQ